MRGAAGRSSVAPMNRGNDRSGVTTFMAECFWPGVSEQKLREAGARARRAAAASGRDGDRVRYLGAILVPADETAFCLFEAASVEAVRQVSARAAIPFERVVETVRLEPKAISTTKTDS